MYTIQESGIKIEGLLAGDRILSMQGLVVIDHTHNYEAEVTFKPPKVIIHPGLERNHEKARRLHVRTIFKKERDSCFRSAPSSREEAF